MLRPLWAGHCGAEHAGAGRVARGVEMNRFAVKNAVLTIGALALAWITQVLVKMPAAVALAHPRFRRLNMVDQRTRSGRAEEVIKNLLVTIIASQLNVPQRDGGSERRGKTRSARDVVS